MAAIVLKKNDKQASILIITFTIVVFAVVSLLSGLNLKFNVGFNVHIFALINAVINFSVSMLLISALVAVKAKKIALHRNLMFAAILLSVLFLVSYIAHHLLGGDTKYGGEGALRYVYFFILITHIILAGIILPFILFTAYRALISEIPQHKKLAKYTFPLWLYVSITGVLVFLLISPYYVPHI